MKDDPLYRDLPETQDPSATAPAPPRWNRTLAVEVFLWFAGVGAALWWIVPRFGEVYAQVKVPMPALTAGLVGLSRLACAYPAAWVFLALAASFAAGFCPPGRARLARGLIVAMFIASAFWIILALLSPLVGIWGHLAR